MLESEVSPSPSALLRSRSTESQATRPHGEAYAELVYLGNYANQGRQRLKPPLTLTFGLHSEPSTWDLVRWVKKA